MPGTCAAQTQPNTPFGGFQLILPNCQTTSKSGVIPSRLNLIFVAIVQTARGTEVAMRSVASMDMGLSSPGLLHVVEVKSYLVFFAEDYMFMQSLLRA